MNAFTDKVRGRWDDAKRIVLPLVVGLLILKASLWLAVYEPSLSVWGMYAGFGVMSVGLGHWTRRLLFPDLDLQAIAAKAVHSGQAGHVFVGVCIVLAAMLFAVSSAKASELPPLAEKYLPVLASEQQTYWPTMPDPAFMAAQVEQETCISLKHSRCWSPRAELRTARELGVGLGQVTKTARFDTLTELKAAYPRALAGWSWESAALYDPSYQLRALVLMDRRNWERTGPAATTVDRLAMMAVMYIGGPGRVAADRRVCQATRGCAPDRWYGNIEHTSTLPCKVMPGYGKCFLKSTREYPRNIQFIRRAKYEGML